MPTYAVSDGSKIINVIVADSKEDAEKIIDLELIETNGKPWTGWILNDNGVWTTESPYDSWLWNGDEWVPPITMPTLGGYHYYWNEEKKDWDKNEIEQPYPSWVKDDNNNWVSPVPMPETENPFQYKWDEETLSWIKV